MPAVPEAWCQFRHKRQRRTALTEGDDLKSGIKERNENGSRPRRRTLVSTLALGHLSRAGEMWARLLKRAPGNKMSWRPVCVCFPQYIPSTSGHFLLLGADHTLIETDAVTMVTWAWMFFNFGMHSYHKGAGGITWWSLDCQATWQRVITYMRHICI